MLLRRFKDYLVGNKQHSFEDSSDDEDNRKAANDVVFVKKWLKTKHAYIFRLNNKVIQTCFMDSSELVICVDTKQVTYYDRNKHKRTLPMSEALKSPDAELVKRMKYSKDILTQFLAQRSASSPELNLPAVPTKQ